MNNVMEQDFFYPDGELKVSLYILFRYYFNKMEEHFLKAELEQALFYEEKIKAIKSCFQEPITKEDVECEMHLSKCTQMSWPFRKRKGINALYLKQLKEAEEEEEDYE